MTSYIPQVDINQLETRLTEDFKHKDPKETGFWTDISREISDTLWVPQLQPKFLKVQPDKDVTILHTQQPANVAIPEQPNADEQYVTRKCRIYPDQQQREYFERCFGIHRVYYNAAVDFLQSQENLPSRQVLRNAVNNKLRKYPDFPGYEQMFCDSRDAAIELARTMAKSAESNKYRQQSKGKMGMGHITKRKGKGVICVCPKAFGPKYTVFRQKLGNKSQLKFRARDWRWLTANVPKPTCECQLIREPNGKYYLCLVYTVKQAPSPYRQEFVALDPGLRTFQTYYSEAITGKIKSEPVTKHLARIKYRMRQLTNLMNTRYKNARRTHQHIKQRLVKLRHKVSNIVTNYHRKIAKWLVDNFKTILLPKFSGGSIAKGSKNRRNNSSIYSLAHYKFRQRLIHKASTVAGSRVILCKENYTTMTCGDCGLLNRKVGASKVHRCRDCGISVDRDINAARNIYIRSFTKYCS